jgi:hypothetical protein
VTDAEVAAHLHRVVGLELGHWVPGASQRLIARAFALMDVPYPGPYQEEDCGPRHRDHPLVADWVAGHYVLKCCLCQRLFEHS